MESYWAATYLRLAFSGGDNLVKMVPVIWNGVLSNGKVFHRFFQQQELLCMENAITLQIQFFAPVFVSIAPTYLEKRPRFAFLLLNKADVK
jgi:hypothetical protein